MSLIIKQLSLFSVAFLFLGPFSFSKESRDILSAGYEYLAADSIAVRGGIEANDIEALQKLIRLNAELSCQYHQFDSVESYSVSARHKDQFELGKFFGFSKYGFAPIQSLVLIKAKQDYRDGLKPFLAEEPDPGSNLAPLDNLSHYPHLFFTRITCGKRDKPVPPTKVFSRTVRTPLEDIGVRSQIILITSEELLLAAIKKRYIWLTNTVQERASTVCNHYGYKSVVSFGLRSSFSVLFDPESSYRISDSQILPFAQIEISSAYVPDSLNINELTQDETEMWGHVFAQRAHNSWLDPLYTYFPHLALKNIRCK